METRCKMLLLSLLLYGLSAAPLVAQTPTPSGAALPPAQPPPSAPTAMHTAQPLDATDVYLHLKWEWAPDTRDTTGTLPTWRLLLNRTTAGTTSQELIDLEARACSDGIPVPLHASPVPAPETGSPGHSEAAVLPPSAASSTTYCAAIGCPGPGAYVTLLQAVNQQGASEPSNVVSFGIDATCQRTTYDQALVEALTLERQPQPPGAEQLPPTPPLTNTPPLTETPPLAEEPGPHLEEPSTGPAVVDGREPGDHAGAPVQPEPPAPLQPPGVEQTLVERSEANIKTYEDTQAAERKAYEAVLAKYTALSKQPGASPAEKHKAYQEVVTAYGHATRDILESYRTALTTWSTLMDEYQDTSEPVTSAADSTRETATPPEAPGEKRQAGKPDTVGMEKERPAPQTPSPASPEEPGVLQPNGTLTPTAASARVAPASTPPRPDAR